MRSWPSGSWLTAWTRSSIAGRRCRCSTGFAGCPHPRKSSCAHAVGTTPRRRSLLGVQPDLWPELHAVRAPTLLLSGSDDQKFTTIARQMAAEIPMVWGRVFRGCGHAPHLEAPAEYAAEVTGFLSTPWFDQASFQSGLHET